MATRFKSPAKAVTEKDINLILGVTVGDTKKKGKTVYPENPDYNPIILGFPKGVELPVEDNDGEPVVGKNRLFLQIGNARNDLNLQSDGINPTPLTFRSVKNGTNSPGTYEGLVVLMNALRVAEDESLLSVLRDSGAKYRDYKTRDGGRYATVSDLHHVLRHPLQPSLEETLVVACNKATSGMHHLRRLDDEFKLGIGIIRLRFTLDKILFCAQKTSLVAESFAEANAKRKKIPKANLRWLCVKRPPIFATKDAVYYTNRALWNALHVLGYSIIHDYHEESINTEATE